jgi:hypothetical protein
MGSGNISFIYYICDTMKKSYLGGEMRNAFRTHM